MKTPRLASAFLLRLLALICISATTATHAAAKRPNILFAFADDWGRCASIYAEVEGAGSWNDVVKTPNFDRIAREGVLFKNAFVTAPSCTPCRSSLLSGQYFFRTHRGAILQGAIWDPQIPSYPLLLRKAGYHIGQTYKVWSPGSPVDAPYGGHETGYEKAGGKFNQFSQNVTRMVNQGRTIDDAKQVLYDEVMGNFGAFMNARQGDEPFCYWFGPTLVHRKWTKGSGKTLWGIDPDDLKGRMPKFLPDVHEVREDLADYMGEIQAFDHALGLLLKDLEKRGELDNTLVVVSGDHGAPGFPNGKCNLYDYGTGVALAAWWPGKPGGRVVDDFVNLMDLAPTFLEAGGVSVPKVMTGRSLVNVLESKKAGLVDPQRTWVITGRERHVAASRPGFTPYPQRALRTKDHLYIINFKPERWPMGNPFNLDGPNPPSHTDLVENTMVTFMDFDSSPTKAWMVEHRNDPKWQWHYETGFGRRPREELFDLKSDPDQVNNVAGNRLYEPVLLRLRTQLMAKLREVEDPRVVENPPRFEKAPFTDEWKRPARPKRKANPKGGKKK